MKKGSFLSMPITAVAFSLLSACAADPEAESRRDALPDYAMAQGMGWLVNCPNETVTSEFFNLGSFYDDAGALMSHERFCEVNQSRSRIRRN